MTDAEKLKEIKARLVGRVDIKHEIGDEHPYDRFVVMMPVAGIKVFPYPTYHSREHVWQLALQFARTNFPGHVIFGPPGYDTGL